MDPITLPVSPLLFILVSLCAFSPNSSLLVSNTTHNLSVPFQHGVASFSGPFPRGGTLFPDLDVPFDLAISEQPISTSTDRLPLFADSTAHQAIIFSPPFSPPRLDSPTYPNYSLPFLQDSPPPAPNFTLLLTQTDPSTPVLSTACHLATRQPSGTITNQSLWLRDDDGWRIQWLVSALSPSTNYTAYVLQNSTVSGPIYFTTKSPTFSCPLVFSLPYCPTVAYPVPLPSPPSPLAFYDASTLPPSVSTPILEYITNFTTTLLTFACGRDLYSPLTTCADCQRAYRTWLCTIAFTRCSEYTDSDNAPQFPLPALIPQLPAALPRNPIILPPVPTPYTALLPCLEVCTAVDRACPNFLGFRCPHPEFNAAQSYGVGYIDSGKRGHQGGGVTGVSQDRWGHIWCNGIH